VLQGHAQQNYPNIRLLPFRRNGGSGTARRIGTQQARGEIVVWTDADMTYENERIPELVRVLLDDPTYDQVVGARTTEEGTHKWARVPAKWLIRKIAERLTNQDPGPQLGSACLPSLGSAALSAAAARRLLLRHDDHDRVLVQPARHPVRAHVYAKRAGVSKFHFVHDAYRYILQVLRMVMYFDPLKVLMPAGPVDVRHRRRQGCRRHGAPPLLFPGQHGAARGQRHHDRLARPALADLVVRSRDGV
jgi:glycosyltransferase involved in cell wall biosynthesis